jgi:transcriptional regulator with XRE-family HTH domain
MDFKQRIAEIINQILKEKNLTHKELGDKLGVDGSQITRYSNAEIFPCPSVLINLAKILNKTIDWILTGKEYIINNDALLLKENHTFYKESQNKKPVLGNLKETGERIQKIRKLLKLSPEQFANKYNLPNPDYVIKLENGFIEPSLLFLLQLSEDNFISIDEILKGKKPKRPKPEFLKYGLEVHMPEFPSIIPPIKIISPNNFKNHLEKIEEQDNYIPIPLISDSIAAGDPIKINEKDITDFFIIHKSWVKSLHFYRCLWVKGNSMSPILEDGFIVAIDCTDNEPRRLKGKMIAARYQDGITIKWLQITDDFYILKPQNISEYQPIVIPLYHPNPIIGKIAWWWGRTKD